MEVLELSSVEVEKVCGGIRGEGGISAPEEHRSISLSVYSDVGGGGVVRPTDPEKT